MYAIIIVIIRHRSAVATKHTIQTRLRDFRAQTKQLHLFVTLPALDLFMNCN